MPRARIDKNGIEIAKQGFDVDTAAPQNIAFSTRWNAAHIFTKGTMSPTAAWSGFMSDQYNRSVVSYGRTFARPPIVFAMGHMGSGSLELGNCVSIAVPFNPGTARVLPFYQIMSYTDRFEFFTYARFADGGPNPDAIATWSYIVLDVSYL